MLALLRRPPAGPVAALAALLVVGVVAAAVLGSWQGAVVGLVLLQSVLVLLVLAGSAERRAEHAALRSALARDHARVLTDLARVVASERDPRT